jgi:hypothetical protein
VNLISTFIFDSFWVIDDIQNILHFQEDGMLEAGWARINSLLGRGKEPLVDRQPHPSPP